MFEATLQRPGSGQQTQTERTVGFSRSRCVSSPPLLSQTGRRSPRFGDMANSRFPGTPEISDEQLMLEAAKGDLDAFGELVERHHQRALNLAYRLSGDTERSKDVVQESFLRILKAAHNYEPRARFTSYLYSVIRNMIRETARWQRRRRETSLEDRSSDGVIPGIDSDAVEHPPTPDVVLQRTEVQERLMEALGGLPDDLRAVFVLSDMEQLSYKEIAQICDCPIGTVASRKHAAIAKLRALLRPMRNGR